MKFPLEYRLFVGRFVSFLLAWLALFSTVFLFYGCGPMPNMGGAGKPRPLRMPFIVHNNDIAYPASVTVSWWLGSTVLGSEWREIPAGGSAAFVFAALPDGVEVKAVAWGSGAVWMSPDYKGAKQFDVFYPQGHSRRLP